MSYSTALGITPNRRPVNLGEFRNGHGWSPSIWRRLLPDGVDWMFNDAALNGLLQSVESLPLWKAVPLVLTFDTGVIPWTGFAEAADLLEEFDAKMPSPADHVNHVPAVAALLRSQPETPLFGMWCTSVSENPFDPWDDESDDYGSGIPLRDMYLLEHYRGAMNPTEFAEGLSGAVR